MVAPADVLATVFTRAGERWTAPVTNLSPHAVFLAGLGPLPFREAVQIELLDHSLRGEVAFSAEAPRGVLVALDVPAEERPQLERLAGRVPVLGPPPVARPEHAVLPRPLDDAHGSMDISDDLLRGGIPELDALDPANLPDGVVVGPGSADLDALSEVLDSIDLLGRAPAHEAPPSDLPGAEDAALPRLEPDGVTVRFGGLEAYRAHVEAHLARGGLVVLAGPLPIGTRRELSIVVPGRAPYRLGARVVFREPGRLSFMLDGFDQHRAALLALAG